jgi:hypothetical protein
MEGKATTQAQMLTFSIFLSVTANTDGRTPVRNALFLLDETQISVNIINTEYDDCETKKKIKLTQQKVLMSAVSWRPVNLLSLPSP